MVTRQRNVSDRRTIAQEGRDAVVDALVSLIAPTINGLTVRSANYVFDDGSINYRRWNARPIVTVPTVSDVAAVVQALPFGLDEVTGNPRQIGAVGGGVFSGFTGNRLLVDALMYASSPLFGINPAGAADDTDSFQLTGQVVLGAGAWQFGVEAVATPILGIGVYDRVRTHGRQTVALAASANSTPIDTVTGMRDFNAVVTAAVPAAWDIRVEGAITNIAAQYTQLIQITNATGVNVPVGNNNTNRTPLRFIRVRRADANVGNVTLSWFGMKG